MTYSWYKTVGPIALIFSFRMLGLFMLIPVFTVYALQLQGATPALAGIALGAYGLTQGLLQIPFGMLSDKWGRKPVISMGLGLFALGSIIGIYTDSIYGIIAARILQGTGAVGSVLIALLADLTPENERTKAMAVIGMTIGVSFSLAMIISPAVSGRFGLSGIFFITALLALLGLILLYKVIPTSLKIPVSGEKPVQSSLLKSALYNKNLQKLNMGIFCQHFILTATFFAMPLVLNQHIKAGHLVQHWHFYLPLMAGSSLCMIPFIILAEKKKQMIPVFLCSIIVTLISQLLLTVAYAHWHLVCMVLFIYFIAFNILEASLPSLVSRQADSHNKGTAMGVYSTNQFLGIFAGGSTAGVVYQFYSSHGIFLTNSFICGIWLFIACFKQKNSRND